MAEELCLLFTGHRLDAPERPCPRFPLSGEALAREMIERAVRRESEAAVEDIVGLAGGSSGGDILFHEICAARGIPTELLLALPRDEYVERSVAGAGPAWVRRFDALHAVLPCRVLGDEPYPGEEPHSGVGSVWQRCNLWILEQGLRRGASGVVLLALWDGGTGDGPGGTADMVQRARQRGARTKILDAGRLSAAS